MDKLTIEMIREKGPCYDPTDVVDENWTGTVLDILKMNNVKTEDRIWVVTHFLPDKINRLFAVWCAREALKLVDIPDPRSVKACDIAEKYANGEATKDELIAAWDTASIAASAAAWDAACDAASAAARAAARAAACDAARAAAGDAAWTASGDAAWTAASDAASAAQIEAMLKLIQSIA